MLKFKQACVYPAVTHTSAYENNNQNIRDSFSCKISSVISLK